MSTLPTNPAIGPEPVWDIATLFPPQGQWSATEYLSLTEGTNRLIEFSNGNIEVLEMPTLAHQRILRYLYTLLSSFVNDRDLGEVLFAALPVQLGPDKYREPDILYLKRSDSLDPDLPYVPSADLVIEIVSEGHKNRERDLVTKRDDYACALIPEYWIVDPEEKRIIVLAIDGENYIEIGRFAAGEQAKSKLLAGFVVDVDAAFSAAEKTR